MQEAHLAVKAKYDFIQSSEEDRVNAITGISKMLHEMRHEIIIENTKDIENAKKNKLSPAMIDRLRLDDSRITELICAVEAIAKQPQVVGQITSETIREKDGLIIQKQRIPLGVVGMIFESRPNVVIDCSCLAIKSGNCIILKGGKEAEFTNLFLVNLVRNAISHFIPTDVVQIIKTHEDVSNLLAQVGLVDVIIPRGGESLIKHVYENSKIPVIAHFKGLCHIYIDRVINEKSAIDIVINAKTQRPGVCNAVETVLLHKDLPAETVTNLLLALKNKATELRLCSKTREIFRIDSKYFKNSTDTDWSTEYLDNILSIKTVNNTQEAISHIQKYGSHHTEAIISEDPKSIKMFQTQVDASSIMINASTRFNDGGEYGLGAELGISTTKLHAYGPMGAKEMTTERFIVIGKGHTRT